MTEGYCIDGGCEYYCCDECLHEHYTEEEYLELYNDGEGYSYWTQWDSDDVESEQDSSFYFRENYIAYNEKESEEYMKEFIVKALRFTVLFLTGGFIGMMIGKCLRAIFKR